MHSRVRFRDAIVILLFIVFIGGFGFLTMFSGYRVIGSNALRGYRQAPKNVVSRLKGFISGIEYGVNEAFFGRTFFIDVYGGIQSVFKKRMIEDINPLYTVYRMNNGQLTFLYPPYDVSDFSNFVLDLDDYLAERGTPLVYVQAPFKVSKYVQDIEPVFTDFVNENADDMIEQLRTQGVFVVDLREEIHKSGVPHNEFFYDTDHHWTSQAGFWAYTKTVDYILRNIHTPLWNAELTTNASNYNVRVYPESFLGSQGRRVGRFYAGLDDYVLITPDFGTEYDVEITTHRGNTVTTHGSFSECIVDQDLLSTSSPVSTNRYAAYLGGDYPFVRIKNNRCASGKLLIMQDSFGLAFSPFMSLNFAETQIIDLRHYKALNLAEYLGNEQFDLVMFVYNPSVYREDTIESFRENVVWQIQQEAESI